MVVKIKDKAYVYVQAENVMVHLIYLLIFTEGVNNPVADCMEKNSFEV